MNRRIHIFGASGAGTTTLGEALSERLSIPHFDTDNYLWAKTTIPFTQQRDAKQREELLKSDLLGFPEWVSSGSLCGWGDFAIPLFTLAVFLWIPAEVRMTRLMEREVSRYGLEAVSPGGWFYENHVKFMAYCVAYDSAGLDVDIRSRRLHEQWISKLPCRVLRIEGLFSVQELTSRVERELAFSGSDRE